MVITPKEIRKFFKWLNANYILFDIVKGKYIYKNGGDTYTIDQLIKIYEESHKDLP